MKNKLIGICCLMLLIFNCFPVYADDLPREDTPDYKVSYYHFDCFNMQDEYGNNYGYGYEMLEGLSNYIQCTFSYIGYDLSAQECEEMLRNGEIDLYTAAKHTEERDSEFTFSKYPAITAKTCMNVKRGNSKVISGDYDTYDGLVIGLLERHTYNDSFKKFVNDKGIECEIVYYSTPTELSNALIDGEVDAIVDSYIRTPEDEVTIEDFGETAYYFMARKENQALINDIDKAIDEMNIDTPNWRSELYNKYYGSQDNNTNFSFDEKLLLSCLQATDTTIKAIMNPDHSPYSCYDGETESGIAYDIFVKTADKLGLKYEFIDVSSFEEYEEMIKNGDIDIWIDQDGEYEIDGENKYKYTDSYLSTSVSVLKRRGTSNKISKIALLDNNVTMKKIVQTFWPNAQIEYINNSDDCVQALLDGDVEAILLMSYMAQRIAKEDVQNRFSVDVVPEGNIDLKMGINADIDHSFYGIWNKTLNEVSKEESATIVQEYLEIENKTSFIAFLFDNPSFILITVGLISFTIVVIILYLESLHSKNKQKQISKKLEIALAQTKAANDAKFNFFSKMSHDIRTPLNAVLGMTQIAKKYQNDSVKLEKALDNITSEGNYLLNMINSILDINQLEHGHIELVNKAFDINECINECILMLKPLSDKKDQKLSLDLDCRDKIVIGDAGRFSQIVINIVSNAIKYTENGGSINVSLKEMDSTYLFRCQDTGVGMSEDFIEHICDDYSRAENSMTSRIEGTGLGMSVVKGLVDLMNGKLTIESKLGVGSIFNVEIPFKIATVKDKELLESYKDKQDYIEFKGKKVLLVEDNALNAEISEELLKSIGFIVDWAENGKIACDMYKNSDINSYFAIFMDMQMPVMDGVEATKQIRSMNRTDNDILILGMSANTLERDRKRCFDAGMNGYISKPVDFKNIIKAIRECIS